MSPFRWDVVGVGFVLALPLLALYLRGDLALDEMTVRLPWCLVGGYVVVAVLRFAATPRSKPPAQTATAHDADTTPEPTATA